MDGQLDQNGSAAPAARDLIAGLDKGLQVIEAFDQERSRLSITEVAARTGLTRAAARRYLITLVHLGYARQQDKVFSLTPKVLRLGQSYLHSRLPRIVQPLLYRPAYSLGEAASAGVLEDDQLVCVAAVSAGRVVSATLQGYAVVNRELGLGLRTIAPLTLTIGSSMPICSSKHASIAASPVALSVTSIARISSVAASNPKCTLRHDGRRRHASRSSTRLHRAS
jgi:IclR family pca regulon transcriptional regulator